MKTYKKFSSYFLLSALICSLVTTIYPKVIIFDLGNVLFSTSRWGVAREVGVWNLALHKLGGGDIKAASFKFLEDTFGKALPVNPQDPQEAWLYVGGDGSYLPQIWCDYMKGALSGADVIAAACPHIDAYFVKNREKRLVTSFIETIFNPAVMAENAYPIPEGAQLLADCAARHDNTVMVLSNWADDAFDALYKKPESQVIFDYVQPEHLMISGKMGMLKPEPAIYAHVKEKLIALDARFNDPCFLAENCVFIDDQIENIVGARKAGITSLWLSDGNYQRIRHELEVLDAI